MAEDRKARLAALAARAKRSNPTNPEEVSKKEESTSKRELKFRNYSPKSLLSSTKRQKVNNLNDESKQEQQEQDDFGKTSLENAIRQVHQTKAKNINKNNNSTTGRKENWDLKRDIETKLSRLERRTQRAIISLLKERLQKEAEEESSNPNNLD